STSAPCAKRPETRKPHGTTTGLPCGSRRIYVMPESWIPLCVDLLRPDVDGNLPRLGVFLLRDLDLEDAVDVVRLDRARIDRAGQRERAGERAVRALDAVVVPLILALEL